MSFNLETSFKIVRTKPLLLRRPLNCLSKLCSI